MAVQGSSAQYTVGSTLSRAETTGEVVEIMVQGHWIAGTVQAIDAMGVLLDCDGEPWTVRLDQVAVVRVRQAARADQALSAASEVA